MRAPWLAISAALITCIACGSRTGLPSDDDVVPSPVDAAADVTNPTLDAGKCSATSASRTPCGPMKLAVGTQETCSLALLRSADALGAVPFTCPINRPGCTKNLPGDCFVVLALLRVGNGHLAAYCDSTTLNDAATKGKLLPYLGQTASPRIAILGNGYTGGVAGKNLGPLLPQKYVDPAALAADFDVVVVSATPYGASSLSADWAKTLFGFVNDYGRGLLAAADYVLPTVSPTVVDPINAITRPMGVALEPVDLGYADLEMNLACVPDMP